jgi:hypothetical protein
VVVRVPDRCASCGERPYTGVMVRHSKRATPGFAVGYCAPCHARTRNRTLRALLAVAVSALFAIGFALTLLLFRPLPQPAIFIVPAIAAMLLGIAAVLLLRPRLPHPPATAPSRAVHMVAFDDQSATVACTHESWARGFAELNGGWIEPGDVVDGFAPAWAAPILGSAMALFVALLVWDYQYPSVFIDHLGDEPISIWIDGERRETIEPFSGKGRPPSIRIVRGPHSLGHSPTGAEGPGGTIDVVVLGSRDHLYNPGMRACYWRTITEYDTSDHASSPPAPHGPLQREEFYYLPAVDHWFEDPPSVVDDRSKRFHVSIERDESCTALVGRGCSEELLNQLLDCYRAARNTIDLQECINAANAVCGGSS